MIETTEETIIIGIMPQRRSDQIMLLFRSTRLSFLIPTVIKKMSIATTFIIVPSIMMVTIVMSSISDTPLFIIAVAVITPPRRASRGRCSRSRCSRGRGSRNRRTRARRSICIRSKICVVKVSLLVANSQNDILI